MPATATLTYADTQTKLVPLATQRNGLVSAATAYSAIDTDGMFLAFPTDVVGVMDASLYSYYNGSHGQIRSDGSVKLDYQGTAVWGFTAKMRDDYRPPYAGGSQINPANTYDAHPSLGPCTYIIVVDAHTGVSITGGAECSGAG